jgi:hypothetical protein
MDSYYRKYHNWCRTGLMTMMLLLGVTAANISAQVTTASVTGVVTTTDGSPVSGASVTAIHGPSGSRYISVSRQDGRFVIPAARVGGPYGVTVSFIGLQTQTIDGVFLSLGSATDLSFVMAQQALTLEGITVSADAGAIISSERTGATTQITRQNLENLPNISGRLGDFVRLTPQASGFSFAGQDNRLNNITVDGAYFNNSFGLGGQPGDRTGVAPISLDAIEQVQVNIAPFDVRQGNFVGAGVNTVTRSGTNEFRGSFRHRYRNEDYVGTQAGDADVSVGTFRYQELGGWVSGPIIRDRLFFFLNYEDESLTEPGTTFRANRGEPVAAPYTRVLARDLDDLSSFLSTNFGYETGPYEGYNHETPATRFLGKIDVNLNDRNKFSVRYSHLDSFTDVLLSNSSSLGFGNRRTSLFGLNYQNSNYQILENIRSVVGEWNSTLSDNLANNLLVGYTSHDESRSVRGGDFFPMVDILEGGSIYTTFGYEPFTPNNELRYSSFQIQNNLTRFGQRHTQTFGLSAEWYESENVFFPGSQSVYSYNSLEDFYTDARDYLANPNRTTSPVRLARFQVRWANVPGQDKPVQPLEVFFAGMYGQNEWRATDDLRVTAGLRVDVPFFGDTGFQNTQVDGMTFRDGAKYSTSQLPDNNLLFSPRLGFNWNVGGEGVTQVRGGTGVFTGRPAYVWISNQIGENGVLTGFEQINNTTTRPFNPNPDHYKPSSVTGNPATSYGLAFTEPSFRFPQLWRTTVAIDRQLPWGLFGTVEALYSRDVNGISYINANLPAANSQFNGVDERPRWTAGTRIVSNVTSAVVLQNQNEGYAWNIATSLERPFSNGLFFKGAYSYGVAKNTVDAGSIAFGSWNNNQHAGDPNNPGLGYAGGSAGHRVFLTSTYKANLLPVGSTMFSVFWEGRTGGNSTFTFAGDANGDGGTSNDLIYIHRDVSEMNFQTYSAGGRTFSATEQAQAWDAYIEGNRYLRNNRGGYAERGAAFLPMRYRTDVSAEQEIGRDVFGASNRLSVRADVLNLLNLLNSDWGVGQTWVTTQPLIVPTAAQGGPADAQGRMQYRLRNVGGELISDSLRSTAGIGDVWRLQLSVRYSFN